MDENKGQSEFGLLVCPNCGGGHQRDDVNVKEEHYCQRIVSDQGTPCGEQMKFWPSSLNTLLMGH